MHALIDCDLFCYEMGSAQNEDKSAPLAWNLVRARVDARIEQILEATEAATWRGYLTGKGNFRDEVATILPYKGTRKRQDRPYWYSGVWNYLVNSRSAYVVRGMEADDALAIHHTGDSFSVLCSRDKDLQQVPGWSYTWPSWKQEERAPHWITEIDGLRNFYHQLLTGDRTDNILGLYNVGDRAACVRRLEEYKTELNMFQEVKHQYQLRFGTYWDMFMCENGRLLWMLRKEDDDWYDRQKLLDTGLVKGIHRTGTMRGM